MSLKKSFSPESVQGKKSFMVEPSETTNKALVDKMALFDSVKSGDLVNKDSEINVKFKFFQKKKEF